MASIVELPRATELHTVDANELWGDQPPPEVTDGTRMPKALNAFVVNQDPKITVIPYFLSMDECNHLRKLVEGVWMPSLVAGSKKATDMSNAISQTRTSWSCLTRYSQTVVVERIEHRLASVAGLPIEQLERLNMVRYSPGQLFNEHHDGAFRPKTVFVYLNDLPEDSDGGDTFFPVLGFSFKPRAGTAVMWSNAQPDGKADSRMLHAGRAPSKGIKYGVNCFFNDKNLRMISSPGQSIPWQEASLVNLGDLAMDNGDTMGSSEPNGLSNAAPTLTLYVLSQDPEMKAAPGFLTAAEVEHVLEQAGDCMATTQGQKDGAFYEGTQTLKMIEAGATPTIQAIETRLSEIAQISLDHLANLRIVRAATEYGLSNRGCGWTSVYICLSPEDEVFFPTLGLRFAMRRGDALMWWNVEYSTGQGAEDFRTLRVHRGSEDDVSERAIGIDAFFHDNKIRAQQKNHALVPDQECT